MPRLHLFWFVLELDSLGVSVKGLHLVDASGGGVYFFFQPLVGTFLGWVFLDEQIGAAFCVDAFFILSGVLLAIKEEN